MIKSLNMTLNNLKRLKDGNNGLEGEGVSALLRI